jgi:hypothetical protein
VLALTFDMQIDCIGMLGLIAGVFGCVFIALGLSTSRGDGKQSGWVQFCGSLPLHQNAALAGALASVATSIRHNSMAIFELSSEQIRKVTQTSFAEEKITERRDLQRLLKRSIEHIAPDTMILAEEYGRFEGSARRIDLLGLNRDAELVVIELKRTDDGGHLELQAIRYAAMISAMTFDDAVDAHRKYLEANGRHEEDPHENIMEFLGPEAEAVLAGAENGAGSVRIILAAADFSKEVTTTVLWLNANGLDITCVRLRPYRLEDARVLLDIQQVIPLPEAQEYTIKIRKKATEVRDAVRKQYRDFTRFDATIGGVSHSRLWKRELVFFAVKEAISKGVTPTELRALVPWRSTQLFFEVPKLVDSLGFVEAFRKAGRPDPKRFFHSDAQLFHLNGQTYALTNQWGDRSTEVVDIIRHHLGTRGAIAYAAAEE